MSHGDNFFPGQLILVGEPLRLANVLQASEPLIPYDGRITFDAATTVARKTLWDGADFEQYGVDQPFIASLIWLTADKDNTDKVVIGSGAVATGTNLERGYDLYPGQQMPPMGPINLKQWWAIGTAADGLHWMYIKMVVSLVNVSQRLRTDNES